MNQSPYDSLSQRSRVLFGVLGATLLVVGGLGMYVAANPGSPGATRHTATFGRAGQLMDERSDVKIRGITVGKVDAVHLDGKGRAVVSFHVDNGVRLPRSTVAHAEPVSVFGPKDLVLALGAGEGTGPYLEQDAAVTQTKDPQELADVAWPAYRLTGAIDPAELATTLHTFSEGLDGQGPSLRRTVKNAGKLTDLAYNRRAEISGLIRDADLLTGEFRNRGDTITGLTADANALSQSINEHPDRFARLLNETGDLANRVGDTLDEHGDSIGGFVDDGGATIDVLYEQRRNIPTLEDGLIGFFGGTAETIRTPGPKGTMIANVKVTLPLDVCTVLFDLCHLPVVGDPVRKVNDTVTGLLSPPTLPKALRPYVAREGQ